MSQRRRLGHRRSRDEELFALAAVDPEAHERLLVLRRTHPQAFRRELARLVRQEVIPAGRRGRAPQEMLDWVRQPLALALADVEAADAAGELTVGIAAALLEEERQNRARPALMEWLASAVERLATAQNRRL